MTRPRSVIDDPVVEEVRKVRQEIWREAGENTAGLLELLDRLMPRKQAAGDAARKPKARRSSANTRRRAKSKIQNPKFKIK